MTFDAEYLEKILNSTPPQPRNLLPLLQTIQEHFRFLPKEALEAVADYLNLPKSKVFAVASFYKAFSLTPKAENVLTVCCGTACHLRGALSLIKALEKRLALELGQNTPDGRYGLESVNCLGACALAPVVTVNGSVKGPLTPEKASQLVEFESI
jgi:NADH-quinone oxidoreductase subunit E